MNIDAFTLRGLELKPHFNIWENKVHLRQPALSFMRTDLLITLDAQIIRDAYGSDGRGCIFDLFQITLPGTSELITQHGSRCMNMGVPAVPF